MSDMKRSNIGCNLCLEKNSGEGGRVEEDEDTKDNTGGGEEATRDGIQHERESENSKGNCRERDAGGASTLGCPKAQRRQGQETLN